MSFRRVRAIPATAIASAILLVVVLNVVTGGAGGPLFDLLRKFIVATGADGYAVVLAWGEIDPEFAAEPVLVAVQRDGQPLGEGQGVARLVVPGDKRGGRHVNRLTRIEIRDAGSLP